jgi:UDP-N-acetyl-D-galactosamine dehydrogenase
LIVAVAHKQYLEAPMDSLLARLKPGGVLVDVKSALDPRAIPDGRAHYWCL